MAQRPSEAPAAQEPVELGIAEAAPAFPCPLPVVLLYAGADCVHP